MAVAKGKLLLRLIFRLLIHHDLPHRRRKPGLVSLALGDGVKVVPLDHPSRTMATAYFSHLGIQLICTAITVLTISQEEASPLDYYAFLM